MARRFPLATAFNMIGLIVAFATFYLLMTQIIYQKTYNHDITDYKQLYRMESDYLFDEWDYCDIICRPFADALQRMPQVESYSLAEHINIPNSYATPSKFLKGDTVLEYTFTQGNNTVVSSLTDHRVDGEIEWTDSNRNGIIIPASIAKEYFGTTMAAGKSMLYLYTVNNIQQIDTFVVRGVYEDFAPNTEAWNCIYRNIGDFDTLTFYTNYRCIVKFKQFPDDIKAWTDSLKRAIVDMAITGSESPADPEEDTRLVMATKFKFTPLESSYFEHNSYTTGNSGFKAMYIILVLMSIIVIIIATINFLNFSLVESPMRIRSLNTRMVLGAERHTLRLGLVTECVIISLSACIIALACCALLINLPATRLLMDGSIVLGDHNTLILVILGIAVLVGIVAGVYPAIFATSFPPAIALKGTFGLTPQGRKLLTALLGMQLFISLLMVSYIGILYLQRNHIINSDYGYHKDQILTTSLPIDIIPDSINKLQEQLLSIPGVQGVSFSNAPLGTTDSQYMIKKIHNNQLISYRFINTDTKYMSTMGIEMAQGRDFNNNDTTAAIINEAALQQWNWLKLGDKIPTSFYGTDSVTIVGVCKGFRYATTRIGNNRPFAFILAPDMLLNTLNVSTTALKSNRERVRVEVSQTVKNMFGDEVKDAVYFNKELEKTYQNEFHFIKLVNILTFICLVVTFIGVFCMTMFETEYRRKEIGIRKVAGATTGEIVWMLCRRYGWLILISFALAVPIAWYSGDKTLNYFAQHTNNYWWIFPLGLLFVSFIMLGTVVLRSWRTARENPSESIKNE